MYPPRTRLGDASALTCRFGTSGLPVTDELFLMAINHHTGRTWLPRRTAGIGLAAGLLAELILGRWLDIRDGSVHLVRRDRPSDELAGAVRDYLIWQPQYRAVSTWLAFLAPFAIDSVGHRLMRAGLVQPVKQHRIWSRATYVPLDLGFAATPAARLARLLTTAAEMSERDAVLAGLVAMTGLTRHLLWNAGDYDAGVAHLSRSVARLRPAFQQLGALAESAIRTTTCRASS